MNSDDKESNLSRDNTLIFIVYILRTSSNTLYIGQTNNLERRLREHNSHTAKSAKYMLHFFSFDLVYAESFVTRAESMKREVQLKKWSRAKKEALITNNLKLLKNCKDLI